MKNAMAVTVDGREAAIPPAWLMGCTYTHQKQGLDYRMAVRAAIQQWLEQEAMATEFEAQRAKETA